MARGGNKSPKGNNKSPRCLYSTGITANSSQGGCIPRAQENVINSVVECVRSDIEAMDSSGLGFSQRYSRALVIINDCYDLRINYTVQKYQMVVNMHRQYNGGNYD
jgi:hypothetical protein